MTKSSENLIRNSDDMKKLYSRVFALLQSKTSNSLLYLLFALALILLVSVFAADELFASSTDTIVVSSDTVYNIASDPVLVVENITLTEDKSLFQDKAVIGKPVRWIKKIDFNYTKNSFTVNITSDAINFTVYKVLENATEEIPDDKIVINPVLEEVIEKKSKNNDLLPERTAAVYEESSETVILVNDFAKEVEVEYYTPGPELYDENISETLRRITIASEIHYEDILAYTDVPNIDQDKLKLFWLVNGSRTPAQYDSFDFDSDGKVDFISWTVPHLSNQTYELEITIFNVQSYPTVGGNWTVEFYTTASGTLNIKAIHETTWTNYAEASHDLRFIEVKCGNETLPYDWNGLVCSESNSCYVSIPNFNCNQTAYETSKVLTIGKHDLEFEINGAKAYAHNFANVNCEPGGDLATTCVLNHTYYYTDGEVLQGAGNFILGSNGTLINNTNRVRVILNFSTIRIDGGGGILGGNITLLATNISILPGATVNATGLGFTGGYGDGSTLYAATGGSGGAGYGSTGGAGTGTSGGTFYGSFSNPLAFGSGAGNTYNENGANGGGIIFVNVTNTLILHGMLNVKGNSGTTTSGGGSGGSVNLRANVFNGSGYINVSGGNGGVGGGGGAGGRVAIIYNSTLSNWTTNRVYLNGGAGGTGASNGGFGSLYPSALCYQGSVDDTCYCNSAYNWLNGETISGNNLVIQSGCSIINITTMSKVILNFTSIVIQSGGSISGGNITILAQNLTINSGGTISTNTYGYPAATGTGAASSGTYAGGGGAHGGAGSTSYDNANGYTGGGSYYGSSLAPINFGSGGGSISYQGTITGGSGGGAIRIIVSDTLNLTGTMTSNGQSIGSGGDHREAGGGAGGSIYITTERLAGTGYLTATGGNGYYYAWDRYGGNGGGGRIAVYYNESSFTGIGSCNVNAGSNSANSGSDGTLIFVDMNDNSAIIEKDFKFQDNTGNAREFTDTSFWKSTNPKYYNFTNLTFRSGVIIEINAENITINVSNVFNNLSNYVNFSGIYISTAYNLTLDFIKYDTLVLNSSTIYTYGNERYVRLPFLNNSLILQSSTLYGNLNLSLVNLTVLSGSTISANYNGHAAATGLGAASSGTYAAGGGAYGGAGSTSYDNANGYTGGGSYYGSSLAPINFGSGGGSISYQGTITGGSGGGAIRLVVSDTLNLAGTITSNGQTVSSGGDHREAGGGSGGSIYITTERLTGTGYMTATGGTGYYYAWDRYGGNGGGGRIAVYYNESSFTGIGSCNVNAGSHSANSGEDGSLIFVDVNDNSATIEKDFRFQDNIGSAAELTNTTFWKTTNPKYYNFTNLSIRSGSYIIFRAENITLNVSNVFNNISEYVNFSGIYLTSAYNITMDFIRYSSLVMNSSTIYTYGNERYVRIPFLNETLILQSSTLYGNLNLSVANLSIMSGSTISANYIGHTIGAGAASSGTYAAGGGAYGGAGSTSYDNANGYTGGGSYYGSSLAPINFGSGGGSISYQGTITGGSGGGAIRLVVSDTLNLAGTITSNGQAVSSGGDHREAGGGSGGSIYVTTKTITGSGYMTATGGTGYYYAWDRYGGNGGGGRIAVYYNESSFTGIGSCNVNAGSHSANSGEDGSLIFVDVNDNSATIEKDFRFQDNIGSAAELTNTTFWKTTNPKYYNFTNLTIRPSSTIHFNAENMAVNVSDTLNGNNNIINLTSTTIYSSYNFTLDFPRYNSMLLASSSLYTNGNLRYVKLPFLNNSLTLISSTLSGNLNLSLVNLTVGSGSTIHANYLGYYAAQGSYPGSAQTYSGGGASHGGLGAVGNDYGTYSSAGSSAYGSSLAPITFGSGGGNTGSGATGGSGGGVIRINCQNTLQLDGTITVNGQNYISVWDRAQAGSGSGGSIYITTEKITGSGYFTATGGNAYYIDGNRYGGNGGGGRIAIYYNDSNFTGIGSCSANGGSNSAGSASPGTIIFVDNDANSAIVEKSFRFQDNTGVAAELTNTTFWKTTNPKYYNFTNLTFRSGSIIYMPVENTVVNVTSTFNSNTTAVKFTGVTIYSPYNYTYDFPRYDSMIITSSTIYTNGNLRYLIFPFLNNSLTLISSTLSGNFNLSLVNLTVGSGSTIHANYLGYYAAQGSYPGSAQTYSGGGASHGGLGAVGNDYGTYSSAGSSAYGSSLAPITFGSGGGNTGSGATGGSGGGVIRINCQNTLQLDGTITVNGQNYISVWDRAQAGSGSGGSIYVTTEKITGSGYFTATGGNAYYIDGNRYGGNGGGGRIAIYYNDSNFTGIGSCSANGGSNSAGSAERGTLIFVDNDANSAIVEKSFRFQDNTGVGAELTNTTFWKTTNPKYYNFTNFTIRNGSTIYMPIENMVVNVTSTFNSNATAVKFAGITIYSPYNYTYDFPMYDSLIIDTSTVYTNGNLRFVKFPFLNNSLTLISSTLTGNFNLSLVNLTVDSGSTINANYLGYYAAQGTASGSAQSYSGGGAAHGGSGSNGYDYGTASSGSSSVYGSYLAPVTFGSGGANTGSGATGGSGGGIIRINCQDTFRLDGTITANGQNYISVWDRAQAGSGSGGSIFVTTDKLLGAGYLTARGGSAYYIDSNRYGGSGGGGRIALHYRNNSFNRLDTTNVSGGSSTANSASAGTLLLTPGIMPIINFVDPTPANSTGVSRKFTVNATIQNPTLWNITYFWNGTNYTVFNSNNILIMGFNNDSNILEDNYKVSDIANYDLDGGYGRSYSSMDYFTNNGYTTDTWTESGTVGIIDGEGSYISRLTTTTNPYFFKDVADFNASYNHMEVRYKSYVNGPNSLKLYYTDNVDCATFAETCQQAFDIIGDGEWHILDVAITDPNWVDNDGRIDDLRFNLNGATSTSGLFYTDYLRFYYDNITTAPALVDGVYEKALQFDGFDDFVDIENFATLNFGTFDFTLSAWIKTTSSNTQYIISKFNLSDQYSIKLVNGYLSFDMEFNNNNLTPLLDTRQINDGQWHHVAVAFQRNGNAVRYIDGLQSGSTTAINANVGAMSNTGRLQIGRHGSNVSYFNGTIDEVMIWNKTLTASEINFTYGLNLKKYAMDKWLVTINQTGLRVGGKYIYQMFANDKANYFGSSEVKNVSGNMYPEIHFSSPTTSSGFHSQNYIEVTVEGTDPDNNIDSLTVNLYDGIGSLISSNSSRSNPFTINYTGLLDGSYYFNASINDTLESFNVTDYTINAILDTTLPNISIIIPVNNSHLNSTLNKSINFTWAEANPDSCWYNLNYNPFQNFSMNCSQNMTITGQYGVWNHFNMWMNDSAGNIGAAYARFLINNIPPVPANMTANGTHLYSYAFDWDSLPDADNDPLIYHIRIYDDHDMNFLVAEANVSSTAYLNDTLADGLYYWHVRAYDGYDYSQFTEPRAVSVVQARINITSPSSDIIVYPGSSYSIIVNETMRSDWINNVTITVLNDGYDSTYQAENNGDIWNFTYVVPVELMPIRLQVIASAFNASNERVNASIYLRVTRTGLTSQPVIQSFCAEPMYQAKDQLVNVSSVISGETLLSFASLTLLYPNSTSENLQQIGTYKDNLTYYYNYTYNVSALGQHRLYLAVNDINSKSANRSIYSYAALPVAVSIISNGYANLEVRDSCTNRKYLEGTALSSVLPEGLYTINGFAPKVTATYVNANVSSSPMTLSFNDIGEIISKPLNRRAIDQFIINTSTNFETVQIVYNYTNIIQNILDEDNLEIYSCYNISLCTWVELEKTLNVDSNTLTFNAATQPIFMIAESAAPVGAIAPILNLTYLRKYTAVGEDQNISLQIISEHSLRIINLSINGVEQENISYYRNNNTYFYNYSITPIAAGAYRIEAYVKDEYDLSSVLNSTFYANNSANITFFSPGMDSLEIKDVENSQTLFSGTVPLTLSLVPGNYSLTARKENLSVTLINASVLGNLTVISYADLTTNYILPQSRRMIEDFEINSSANYSLVNISFNYSAYTVFDEDNLEAYKNINSRWNILNSTIDVLNNLISVSSYNLSEFMIAESGYTPTTYPPAITQFSINKTFIQVNGTQQITLSFTSNHTVHDVSLHINSVDILPYEALMLSNVSYRYRYNYTPSEIRDYLIIANISDIYNHSVSSQKLFYADYLVNMTLYAPGINTAEIKDENSGEVLANGVLPIDAEIVAGNYTIDLYGNYTKTNIEHSSLRGNLSIMSFEDINSTPILPRQRRLIEDFGINISVNRSTQMFEFNYTGYSVFDEDHLEVYWNDNNRWKLLSNLIDTGSNTLIFNPLNFTEFMIGEAVYNLITTPPEIRNMNLTRAFIGINTPQFIRILFRSNYTLNNITVSVNGTILTPDEILPIPGNLYLHIYNYTPFVIGEHSVMLNITDVYNNTISRERKFCARNNLNISLNAKGHINLTLQDILSGDELAKNLTIRSTEPEGKYRLTVDSANMTVIMENLTVDGTYEYALNITPHAYNYLEGLPSNSTSISEFSLETPAEYAYVNITYNYTNLLENITNERSLRVFKCHSAGNCTWQEINEVEIDTENNTLKIQVYNLSVFSVSESIRTVNSTQTVTVAGPSGGGGGGATRTVEKEVTKIVQMDVITQPFVSTLAEETVTVPVAIINNGEKDLTDIQLSTDASSSDVSADLAPTVIGSLPSGSMTYVDMTLTSPKLNGTYQVTISAESADPAINTSSIIYMEVNDKYLYNRTLVETKLDFITQLIEENPECADLTEFFDKAKEEYAKENFDKAYSLTMSAINSCRSLISLREKNSRVKLDVEKPGSTYQYLWLITGVIVLVLLVVLFLAVLDFIYRRKRSNTVHHEQKRKRIFI